MKVTITGLDRLSHKLRAFVESLTGAQRTELNHAMGAEVQHVTAEHLARLAGTRHATASRLGAKPTNHLAQAAEKVAAGAALTTDSGGATLAINHPGMSRAFGNVTIRPSGGGQFLTIPLNAAAYGRRVGELEKFILIKKGSGAGNGADQGKKPIDNSLAAFLLVRSVTQKQDRTLLPSSEQWEKAAAKGAINYLRRVVSGT